MTTSSSYIRKPLSQFLCCFASGLLFACSEPPAESIGLPTTGANVVSAELIAANATDNP